MQDRLLAGGEVGLHGLDDRRHLHRRDDLVEEPLLRPPEGGHGCALGLRVLRLAAVLVDGAGQSERLVDVLEDHLPRFGQRVVDFHLRIGEGVFETIVFHAVVGQAAGDVGAERLHGGSDHLHGGDPALLDAGDELPHGGEGRAAAPQAKPLRIGKVGHFRRAGRRHVDDASILERPLEFKAGECLGRRLLEAAVALLLDGVRHVVGFVEGDHAVEVLADPIDDLLDACRDVVLALSSDVLRGHHNLAAVLHRDAVERLFLGAERLAGRDCPRLRARRGVDGHGLALHETGAGRNLLLVREPLLERVVGRKEDAAGGGDGVAVLGLSEVEDQVGILPQSLPVPTRVLDQRPLLGEPHRLAPAASEVVEDDAGDLAALADAGPVADEEAAAHGDFALGGGEHLLMRLAGVDDGLELRDRKRAALDKILGDRRGVGWLGRENGRHGRRLDERARVGLGVLDHEPLRLVRLVDGLRDLALGTRRGGGVLYVNSLAAGR